MDAVRKLTSELSGTLVRDRARLNGSKASAAEAKPSANRHSCVGGGPTQPSCQYQRMDQRAAEQLARSIPRPRWRLSRGPGLHSAPHHLSQRFSVGPYLVSQRDDRDCCMDTDARSCRASPGAELNFRSSPAPHLLSRCADPQERPPPAAPWNVPQRFG